MKRSGRKQELWAFWATFGDSESRYARLWHDFMRDDFSEVIKDALAKRFGCRCCNPGGRNLTSSPHEAVQKAVILEVQRILQQRLQRENNTTLISLQQQENRSRMGFGAVKTAAS